MKELTLFKLGIKPAILIGSNSPAIPELRVSGYCEYKSEWLGNCILFSHHKIDIVEGSKSIGVALGYYPGAVETFDKPFSMNLLGVKLIRRTFIDYGGIHFATNRVFKESLEWCERVYAPLMRENNLPLTIKRKDAITLSFNSRNKKISIDIDQEIKSFSLFSV